MQRMLIVVGLLGISVAVSGCVLAAAGAAGAGTAAYVRGQSTIYVASDVPTAHRASHQALEELGLRIIDSSHDALAGRIVARDLRARRVTVTIDGIDWTGAKISVRVGIFGDDSASMTILDNIRARL